MNIDFDGPDGRRLLLDTHDLQRRMDGAMANLRTVIPSKRRIWDRDADVPVKVLFACVVACLSIGRVLAIGAVALGEPVRPRVLIAAAVTLAGAIVLRLA